MDFSEALKRIYRYLDRLDELAEERPWPPEVKACADGIRIYVDEIAQSVDYEQEE